MIDEKYITPDEGARAKAQPLGLKLHRDPPSIAPYFLEEIRKYLEKEYGSQRIYQGGLRVYTTLDSTLQVAANAAMRRGLRVMDRRARGFVAPTESVLKDGELPAKVHLEDWDWPFAVGDVVHGVVRASDKKEAKVQIGAYAAVVTPADIAWTRKTAVSDALPPGVVAPFEIVSKDDETKV